MIVKITACCLQTGCEHQSSDSKTKIYEPDLQPWLKTETSSERTRRHYHITLKCWNSGPMLFCWEKSDTELFRSVRVMFLFVWSWVKAAVQKSERLSVSSAQSIEANSRKDAPEWWVSVENDRGGRESPGEKKEGDKQWRQRIRKQNKVIKGIWETGKSEKSRTCFLIFSPPGKRKQTDKEERDNKEKMDCSISKHPRASEEKEREREKRCHPQRGRGKQQIPFPGLLPTKAKVANDPGTLPLTFSSGRVFMPGWQSHKVSEILWNVTGFVENLCSTSAQDVFKLLGAVSSAFSEKIHSSEISWIKTQLDF